MDHDRARTLRHVTEAKYGAPVYSLHPPMVATAPEDPLDNSPVHAVCTSHYAFNLAVHAVNSHVTMICISQ